MGRIGGRALAIIAPSAMVLAMVAGLWGAPAAQAYGTEHVYQLTFSLNCNDKNSPYCAPDQFNLGGVWGWSEPDSDGTADTTLTFCSHAQGEHGAFHENLDPTWSIVDVSQIGDRFPLGTDPNGQYIIFDDNSDMNFLAMPATPGHYSVTFGPGIRAEGTVTQMH
jgi:hypothetical protein